MVLLQILVVHLIQVYPQSKLILFISEFLCMVIVFFYYVNSSRLSESPSNNSGDANLASGHPAGSEWDSDMEVETDPPDWQTSVPPDDLASLPAHEKKRQDVINGE